MIRFQDIAADRYFIQQFQQNLFILQSQPIVIRFCLYGGRINHFQNLMMQPYDLIRVHCSDFCIQRAGNALYFMDGVDAPANDLRLILQFISILQTHGNCKETDIQAFTGTCLLQCSTDHLHTCL